MTRPEPAGPDIVSRALARDRLGVPSVVFFGVAGAAPLTVILGAVTTIYAVVGSTVVPVSYLVAAAILAVFTVGFVAMSRHIVNSGAFYSYISQGLGRVTGVGAAFVALPAYAVMQIGLFGLFGVVASGILEAAGLHYGWFACALVAWALVSIMGLLWVDLSGKVLAVLLVAEITLVLVYDLVMILHPAGGGSIPLDTLSPVNALTPEFAALLVVAIGGFVGFEATVVLSEEAKDPKRTIARATQWAVLLPGLLCALSAWAMSVATGPDKIVASAKSDETDLVFNLVAPHVPAVLVQIGYVLFLTSVFAALLAFHAAVARYQFALGRERVLPSAWGRTHPRTGAPLLGSITQSVVALGVLIAYASFGLNPLVHLFAWLTTAGGLGVLILMWGASLAVMVFFVRNRLENVWRGRIAPFLAFLFLSVILLATIVGLGDLLGVPGDSIFNWLFPAAYGVCALIGFVWAFIMRAARPEVYAAIGRGADFRPPAAPSGPTTGGQHAVPTGMNGARVNGNTPKAGKPLGYDIKEVVIRDVEPINSDEVCRLLAGTIGEQAVARWLMPDPATRRDSSPAYFEIFVDHAVQHGEVYATVDPGSGDLIGVALWFPFTQAIPPPRDYDLRLKDVCGPSFDRVRDLDAALEVHHPVHPHHYLAFLAVRPDKQNLGIGSALLQRHHARADAAGIPTYLEANDLRNRDLYMRHGYAVDTMIQLPDGGPPIWPMSRSPRALRPTQQPTQQLAIAAASFTR